MKRDDFIKHVHAEAKRFDIQDKHFIDALIELFDAGRVTFDPTTKQFILDGAN